MLFFISGNATLDCNFKPEKSKNATLEGKSTTLDCDFGRKSESEIIQLIRENPSITQKKIQEESGISLGTIKRILPKLQEEGILIREGGKQFGKWIVKDENNNPGL